jgi:hypothetical protein
MTTSELSLVEVLDLLEYSGPQWKLSIRDAENSMDPKGIIGRYLYITDETSSSSRPAIVVANVNNASGATEIQKQIWNEGISPFLLILLPSELRIYSAYSYEREHPESSLILTASRTVEEIKSKLLHFLGSSINQGLIWSSRGSHIRFQDRVDNRLLANLKQLSALLVGKHKMSSKLAHSLIGKTLFLRYLRDRDILSDQWLKERQITKEKVFGPRATSGAFRALSDAIDIRFGGEVFPIDWSSEGPLNDLVFQHLACIFSGESTTGQLNMDFLTYDFRFIPTALLSAIYEFFLRAEDEAASKGAYYTPKQLANYVLEQANAVVPLKAGMKVFDPSCGSGVFLVLAYERLIDLERARLGLAKLSPEILKDVLERSIYGVEKDEEACRVAEFSLLLCLLSNIEPPELHKNENFRLPSLHNNQIFHADFFDIENSFNSRIYGVDWIVGNPPWMELTPADPQNKWAITWMKLHEKAVPVDRYQIYEAFAWRVQEFLSKTGVSSLLLAATVLTNQQAHGFRVAFFTQLSVERVANLSNLASVLFDGRASFPAVCLTYRQKSSNIQLTKDIVHHGPFVANQVARIKKHVMAIGSLETEMKLVPRAEAMQGDSRSWFMALWGTYRDEKAIRQIRSKLELNLRDQVEARDWHFGQGVQLRKKNAERGLKRLDSSLHEVLVADLMTKSGHSLSVPFSALEKIGSRKNVRRLGGVALAKAPHLIIKHNLAPFSSRSFLVPHPLIAVSAPRRDSDRLRALSVFFNSSIFRYLLFFSSRWAITRGDPTLEDVASVGFPALSEKLIVSLATEHRYLSSMESSLTGATDAQEEIDVAVIKALKLPREISVIVREFMQYRMSLKNGKVETSATKKTNPTTLRAYSEVLKRALTSFAGVQHSVSISYSGDFCAVNIKLDDSAATVIRPCGPDEFALLKQLAWNTLSSSSQWVYVRRSFRFIEENSILLIKPNRVLDWLETQALLDADQLIAEAINS